MEARVVQRYLHISPRKVRLVADLVRGKRVGDAIGVLPASAQEGLRRCW
jgi:large subunit ribosomal protein L22